MAGICQIEADSEVKCKPHKYFEMIKYSLLHLPTIYPEGYTDAQIIEGDGVSEGSVRLWKYILPGTTEEEVVKCRTTKQDDKTMTLVLFVEEGSVHSRFKHIQVTVQVFPKGEGSLVKWIIEFEKHHGEVPDPHMYLDLFHNLNLKMDAYAHKA
ncbi:hypothetical protein IFM89_011616 [Coptis chinensis]|uniref:Bet v I/Major latex protein domain-containing protein n=1 Tax=Coptis chinensis TaxID=261450 RepID=A0A835H7L6_9MAGN|nr:hypothetical protein IFM89_011616 [Coptis chinensis]